jgi:hypothetical protein
MYTSEPNMIRTQIYLTQNEREALSVLSAATGRPQSELIREAVDGFIGKLSKARREAVLENAAGLWKDRNDLPDFDAMRKAWDREVRR